MDVIMGWFSSAWNWFARPFYEWGDPIPLIIALAMFFAGIFFLRFTFDLVAVAWCRWRKKPYKSKIVGIIESDSVGVVAGTLLIGVYGALSLLFALEW